MQVPAGLASSKANAPPRLHGVVPLPNVYGPASPWPAPMARMVDVSAKRDVPRRAVATGDLLLRPATLRAIRAGRISKGDPVRTAEVAALQAMKRVWEALPHCHPVPITSASAEFAIKRDRVTATCEVAATYKTGVEMEALYGVTVGLLTVWDMVKSLEKDAAGQYPGTRVHGVRVVSKRKGRGADRG